MPIYVGDTVRMQATFKNVDGTLTNPTTTTLKYRIDGGTATTIAEGSLTNSSTGIWHYDLAIATAGTYEYSFEGTGTVDKSEFGTFSTIARPFS